MSDRVYLVGAESVQSAGHAISSAADTIRRAAGEIDEALQRHQRFLDDWLLRFQDVLEKAKISGA